MKDTSKIILGALALLFALTTFFFGFKYNAAKQKSVTYLDQKETLNKEYDNLVVEFTDIKTELETIENENTKLTKDLDEYKADIDKKKARINALLRKDRVTRSDLSEAKALIAQLKDDKNILLAEIDKLGIENSRLKVENQNYSQTLTTVQKEKNELQAVHTVTLQEKEKVETQKEELQKEKEDNASKVVVGSLVPVRSVSILGIKEKSNGKEVETANFKRVDKLAINFTLQNNPAADSGQKEYVVQVVAPDGNIVHNEEYGSGEFVSEAQEGLKMPYTTKTVVDYEKTEKEVSLYWKQEAPYQKGTYSVKVYEKGYEVGQGSFELKGGI